MFSYLIYTLFFSGLGNLRKLELLNLQFNKINGSLSSEGTLGFKAVFFPLQAMCRFYLEIGINVKGNNVQFDREFKNVKNSIRSL